MKGKGRGRILI